MSEQRTRLASVEAYDPREGRWSPLAPLAAPRSSAAVAVLAERLYCMGGSAADGTVLASVEAYSARMDAWVECPPMGSSRSGLCATAL